MKPFNKFLGVALAALLAVSMLSGMALAQDIDPSNAGWMGGLFAGAFCLVWVVMFVIWIAIGVWMYKDAEKRGKSGALWLIIGLILGIIGLIVWLIVRPEIGEKKEEQGGERYCPDCGRSIPIDATVCPYCGTRLE